MADITHYRLTNSHTGPGLAGVLAVFASWRQRAHDRAELARLSSRDLHDMGVSAAQVDFEINKPFWQA
mgnify:FL=1